MGGETAWSVENYRATSFPDLDKEYWDGELKDVREKLEIYRNCACRTSG